MSEYGIRQLRAEIPADLFERVKIQAIKERTTLKELIIEALEDLLAGRKEASKHGEGPARKR